MKGNIIKGAFAIKKNPLPWPRAICAGICSATPIIIGLLLGNFHRSIQRAIGTIVGVLIASIILATHPTGIMVALFILLLGGLTELFMVRNYAFAVMFITPQLFING